MLTLALRWDRRLRNLARWLCGLAHDVLAHPLRRLCPPVGRWLHDATSEEAEARRLIRRWLSKPCPTCDAPATVECVADKDSRTWAVSRPEGGAGIPFHRARILP